MHNLCVREENDIQALIGEIIDFREMRSWEKYHKPKDLAVSLAIEVGELLEHFQWRRDDEVQAYLDDPKTIARVEEEVADVLIYALLLAHGLGSDVPEIIRRKIRRNSRKYPVEKYRGRAHVDD